MSTLNNMKALPYVPYHIIEHLALDTSEDAENLWKLLKYNTYDAISQDNLTFDDKMALVWRNGVQEDYSVFFVNLIEDAIAEHRCILKIYTHVINPINLYDAAVVIAFDFLFGGQMALVEYNNVPCSRGDLFIRFINSVLNGADVGGVGKLAMDDDLSGYTGAKTVVGNQKTFTGVCVYLVTQIAMGEDGTCSE